MTTNINRVLFDYDGTLIIHDAENEGRRVVNMLGAGEEQINEFEKRLSIFFAHYFSVTNRKMTYELYLANLEKVINPMELFGVSVVALDEAMKENCKQTTTLANNAKETLEYLVGKGYQLCVLTNGFYSDQVDDMKRKGIFEYFEKVYAWDNFYTKPDRRAFIRALAGTEPVHNVMIGDSLRADIEPAKKMGIYTVGINMPNLAEVYMSPDTVITDLSEIKTIL